ncbi:hypothetical protein WAK64_20520 [Bacillus spongiae]|uniref:Phage protein n=1 Tax=Bacillus spongiae TaxID=2683610 RepID=A0ABU8HJT4_9BACI
MQLQFEGYIDLCREIAMLEDSLHAMEKEVEFWWIGGKGFQLVSMSNAAERVDKLNEKINAYQELLGLKVRLKKAFDKHLSKLTGLEYRVAYLRYVEKMSLKMIADELGYNYDYIRRVSSKINKSHIGHSDVEKNVI